MLKFIPKRNYTVTVFDENGDYYDDCNCTSMRSVQNYIDRVLNKRLAETAELCTFPKLTFKIEDYRKKF